MAERGGEGGSGRLIPASSDPELAEPPGAYGSKESGAIGFSLLPASGVAGRGLFSASFASLKVFTAFHLQYLIRFAFSSDLSPIMANI